MNNHSNSSLNKENNILKIEADTYFEIAENTMEDNNMFNAENIKTQEDSIRALVTSAIYGYSAELYLKFIISQFGESPPKGHDLNKIYSKIKSRECLNFLKFSYIQYFSNDVKMLEKGFSGILKEVSNNFIDHRYIAEKVQSNKNFEIRLDYNYLLVGYLKEISDEWLRVKYNN